MSHISYHMDEYVCILYVFSECVKIAFSYVCHVRIHCFLPPRHVIAFYSKGDIKISELTTKQTFTVPVPQGESQNKCARKTCFAIRRLMSWSWNKPQKLWTLHVKNRSLCYKRYVSHLFRLCLCYLLEDPQTHGDELDRGHRQHAEPTVQININVY